MKNWVTLVEGLSALTDEQREAILADPRVRRGTKIGINTPLWRGQDGDEGSGFASFGAGFYFTADKSYAKKYGKVSEVSRTNLPDNPLRFDSLNDFQIWRGYVYKILGCNGRDFAEHYYDFGDFIRDLDPTFDGMQIYNGREAVFVTYP